MELAPLPYIYDERGCEIRPGAQVAYMTDVVVRKAAGGLVEIWPSRLVHVEVTSILIRPGSGFCEVGDAVYVNLSDGTQRAGDAENGGWGLLKLADKQ